MGVEGIGARVARKEDKRFITGAGRYVDDMVLPGMRHAVFVRSPHAHADIKSIDVSKARAMPGVVGVLTGRELKADGIGNIICGWMIHSKDGSPMKMGAWSPLAVDRVRYVGDAVAIVIAGTKGQARDAAGRVVPFDALPRAARHLLAVGVIPLRALFAAYPRSDAPREHEGVVAIDDVEVQQDPSFLRGMIPLLRRALPNVQWLLSTASTQLALACEAGEVVALRRQGERVEASEEVLQ